MSSLSGGSLDTRAPYGILTLAAVGFAGVLAVVLTSPDVQSLLVDLVSGALQRD